MATYVYDRDLKESNLRDFVELSKTCFEPSEVKALLNETEFDGDDVRFTQLLRVVFYQIGLNAARKHYGLKPKD